MAQISDSLAWLFGDRTGVACLILGGVVVCTIISLVLERKTRKMYFNHEKSEDDWDLFDDEDE